MNKKLIIILIPALIAFVGLDIFLFSLYNQKRATTSPSSGEKSSTLCSVISNLNFPIKPDAPTVSRVGVTYTISGKINEIRSVQSPSQGFRYQLIDDKGEIWPVWLFVDRFTPTKFAGEKVARPTADAAKGDLIEATYFWDLGDGGQKDGRVIEIVVANKE